MSSNEAVPKGYKPLTCKKCNRGDFYHIQPGEHRGKWAWLDNYNMVEAYESPFDVPHWTICPATPRGNEQRSKMEAEMQGFLKREYQKKEDMIVRDMPSHPPGQTHLPSEKLTPLDREIAAKLVVLEMCVDDIKRLIAKKAADI